MECQDAEYAEDLSLTITSSSGREQAICRPKRRWCNETGEVLILAEVCLNGQFWERGPFERREEDLDLVEDYRIELPQVILGRSALEELLAELNKWLIQPLEIAVELSGVSSQSLRMSFGVDARLISRMDRPVCTVRYSTGTPVTAECAVVVDQSCIRLLRDDLARLLTGRASR